MKTFDFNQDAPAQFAASGGSVCVNLCADGSTGIACLRTGRNFVGVERDAEYYQTACARFAQECDGALL